MSVSAVNFVRRPLKQITSPISGTVDITRVRRIVDSRRFQKLRHRKQLGNAQVAYPDAGHPRFGHCIGAGKWAERITRRWLEWGLISPQDAIDGETFGFLHDIGHGPMSHITDPLVDDDHEGRGVTYLRELAPEIADSGADPERMVRMMLRQDPLAGVVLHTPLGADKLDYLARDGHHSGLFGMPNEALFMDYVYYLDHQVVADIKIYESVQLLMQLYRTMYSSLYFRTVVLLSERYIQRMISILLGHTGCDPVFSSEELVEMVDVELEYQLRRNPIVQGHYERHLARQQPMPAIIYQLDPFHKHNWSGDHPVLHTPIEESVLTDKRLRDPRVLLRIEREIEALMGLSEFSVLAVAPVLPRRFEPQNILFLTGDGAVPLKEISPAWWNAQVEEARRNAILHIGVDREHCALLAQAEVARDVRQIVASVLAV
ncbi:MAG TPA: hypothetical protein VGE59_01935 [Patescibacteria group bacterium]